MLAGGRLHTYQTVGWPDKEEVGVCPGTTIYKVQVMSIHYHLAVIYTNSFSSLPQSLATGATTTRDMLDWVLGTLINM